MPHSSNSPTNERTVRMRDVAERAGVGMMTVSRVLNGTAHVREETRERVYRALEELQYRPNLLARALRGFGTRSIGVILPYLHDPFFASCAGAISTVAKQHAYSVLLATSDESTETETEQLRDLLRHRVEGIIVFPASTGRSRLSDPEFRSTPMVAVDRPVPGAKIDRVVVENQAGARLAVEHLVQHGHRRICFVGLNRRIFTMNARLSGYMKAMQTAGLEPECFLDGHDSAATLEFFRSVRARPQPPTAIFAANGLSATHTLSALAALDVQVPAEMAFISFDDFALADVLRPALTVIRQPVQRAGEEAAELLFARLDGQRDGPVQKRTLPIELILRRSCGCHPS
ncbi:MAG TPA: LacI family DNA-binding transcriptional regulator [Acidobacteriaceae bacterium]